MDKDKLNPDLLKYAERMTALPIDRVVPRKMARAVLRWKRRQHTEGVDLSVVSRAKPKLHLFRPEERRTTTAVLWIHGGGYLIGNPRQDDRLCGEIASRLGATVAASEYRLSPEHPFPAGLDDVTAAWRWLQAECSSLQIDPARIIVAGQSAGGGIAAALVQKLCDADAQKPVAQVLFSPMLDARTAEQHELDALEHFTWNNRLNRAGWQAYLGRTDNFEAAPPYAIPAMRRNFTNLPPTWMGVGDIDLFHDEDLAYAAKLRTAGVDVICEVVPGAPHGFGSLAFDSRLASDHRRRAIEWMRRFV